MADNTDLNAGSGGDTIGTDDIGGVIWPPYPGINTHNWHNIDVSKPDPYRNCYITDGEFCYKAYYVDTANRFSVINKSNDLWHIDETLVTHWRYRLNRKP